MLRHSSGGDDVSGKKRRSRAGKNGPSRDGSNSRSSNQGGGGRRRSGAAGQSGGGQRSGASRSAARGLGGDQVEGRHAVRELLLAGTRSVREVLIVDDLERADIIEDIEELARELHVAIRPMSRKRLNAEAATTSHQGVLARAGAVPERSLDELMAVKDPFILVLDGVTDPGNLGAILRTAECAGVTGVVLGRHRAVHITPTVTKAAAGAIEHLAMAIVGGIPTALSDLSRAGILTVGLDAGGDRQLFDDFPGVDGPIALVLGAEGAGLSRLARERTDITVAVPLKGGLNSLNVAAAAAIACFEVVRRRGLHG